MSETVTVMIERGHPGRLPANLIALRDRVAVWLAEHHVVGICTLCLSDKKQAYKPGPPELISEFLDGEGAFSARVSTDTETFRCAIWLPGRHDQRHEAFERIRGNGAAKKPPPVVKTAESPPPAKPKVRTPPKPKEEKPEKKDPPKASAPADKPVDKPVPSVADQPKQVAKEPAKRPDIIMSRTQQGNRETRVITVFGEEELTMLIRRCANEMPMLVRIHNSGSEQSLDRRHMKPHEALAFAIDDALDAAKHLGQFTVAVLPDRIKLRSTAQHPVYLAMRQPGLPPTLLVRDGNAFTACTMIAATPQTTADLHERLTQLLPKADAGSLGSELDKAATIGAPLDVDELKKRVVQLLADPLIKPPKVEVHNAAPTEIPDKILDLDGPIRFVVMLRARLADGTSRRVQVTTDDYETACRIRFVIAKL